MFFFTTLSIPALATTASLSTATQQMREQFPTSPIGHFVNDQQEDYRNLRQFLNHQNKRAGWRSSGLYPHRQQPQWEIIFQPILCQSHPLNMTNQK